MNLNQARASIGKRVRLVDPAGRRRPMLEGELLRVEARTSGFSSAEVCVVRVFDSGQWNEWPAYPSELALAEGA